MEGQKEKEKEKEEENSGGCYFVFELFCFLLGLCLNSVVKRSKLWWVSFFLGYDFIFFQVLQTLLVTDC